MTLSLPFTVPPPAALARVVAALLLAPLLPGLINRTKAWFAGRRGPPLLQAYFDLAKLLRKGAVQSRTSTWLFVAGPVVGLAGTLAALPLLPWGPLPALLSFPGDLVVLVGLLGTARFATWLAALDTGSSFEGMGVSRDALVAVLAELALFLGLAALVRLAEAFSLSALFARLHALPPGHAGAVLCLLAFGLFLVLLAENARVPVDDPNTHLELTMIHEVMVLDHGGPWFALIQYGACLKLWLFAALISGLLTAGLPAVAAGGPWLLTGLFLAGLALVAVTVGVVESVMARLRLLRIPQLLMGATACAVLALLLGGR